MIELRDPEGDDLEMKQKGLKVALRHPDFLRLWSGQVVSNVGTAISALALLFYAYDLTGSAMAMAVLAMFEGFLLLSLLGLLACMLTAGTARES